MDNLNEMDKYLDALSRCYGYLTSELQGYNSVFHNYSQKFNELFHKYVDRLSDGKNAEKLMQRLFSELDEVKEKKNIKDRVKDETVEKALKYTFLSYDKKSDIRYLLERKIVTDALKSIVREYSKVYDKRSRCALAYNSKNAKSTERLEIEDKELLVYVFKLVNEEYKNINKLVAKKIEFLFNHRLFDKKYYDKLQNYLGKLPRGQNYWGVRSKANSTYSLTFEQLIMLKGLETKSDIVETLIKLIEKIKALEIAEQHKKNTVVISNNENGDSLNGAENLIRDPRPSITKEHEIVRSELNENNTRDVTERSSEIQLTATKGNQEEVQKVPTSEEETIKSGTIGVQFEETYTEQSLITDDQEEVRTKQKGNDNEEVSKKPDEFDKFNSKYEYLIELLEKPLLTVGDKIEMYQHMLYIAKELEKYIYDYNRISGILPGKETELESLKAKVYYKHNPLDLLDKYQEKLQMIKGVKEELGPVQQEQLVTFPNMKKIIDNVNEKVMKDITSKYSQVMIYGRDVMAFELSNRLMLMSENKIKYFYHNFLSNYRFNYDQECATNVQYAFARAVSTQRITKSEDFFDLTGNLKMATMYKICLELFDEMPKSNNTETGIVSAHEIESFIDGCFDLSSRKREDLKRVLAEYQLRHGNDDSELLVPKGGRNK